MNYQPSVNDGFQNWNRNPEGSQYAANTGMDTTFLVQKAVNSLIFDAAPEQFFDLALLNTQQPEQSRSDEFFYYEMGYSREPVVVTAATSAVTYPSTVTVQVSSTAHAATDIIIGTPDNNRAIIQAVDTAANTITIQPMNGDSIEALSVDDSLFILGPIEADGTDEFAAYFRDEAVQRYNYIQLFNRAIRYSEVDLWKLQNGGTTSNFLSMEKMNMYRQFRTDISNAFWNGKRGEVITRSGRRAKTTGGIYEMMIDAGSPQVTTTLGALDTAMEEAVAMSEYGGYGRTRFAFAPNRIIRAASKAFKDEKTRYTPESMEANLMLDSINFGSSNIVLVPYERFVSDASFPASWSNYMFILDMKNIKTRQLWGERSGETPDHRGNGGAKRFKDTWVDTQMGVEFNNPQACALIKIQ